MTKLKRYVESFSVTLAIIAVLAAAVVYIVYSNNRYGKLLAEKNRIAEDLRISTTTLAQIQKERDDLAGALQAAADKNAAFASELEKVNFTVDRLKWISTLDQQLLQKYSKVYFLNENYTPDQLSVVDTKYVYDTSRALDMKVQDRILTFLHNMLRDAAASNIVIKIASAYRSFDTQASLKSGYRVTYGSGANAFSADQGYSEHQLGTALDFTTPDLKGGLTGFQKTDEYEWLKNNAYRYGFILSYPPNNSYYVFEPWHWRFVGIELATKLRNEGKNFYDLDQREINSYLPNIFNVSL